MENKEVSDGIKVQSKFIYELLLDKNHMKVVWTVEPVIDGPNPKNEGSLTAAAIFVCLDVFLQNFPRESIGTV